MKRLLAVTAVAFILALSAVLPAQAGKIVLTNDEWTLSNTGFAQAGTQPGTFALNVANWFTGSTSGSKFLVYSTNFGLTESSLTSVMTGAGNTWTNNASLPQTISELQKYDAVFLAGDAFDNAVLIQYVNGGGNVFLEGGTGIGGSSNEAARWNTFLNAFGLEYGTSYNGVGGNIAINSSHPIFAGVNSLYQNNGNDTLDINASDPRAQVLVTLDSRGLYAVYESVAVPEPGTLLLLGGALLALFGLRRKVSA
jgi:hypothetical protein